MVLWPLAKEAIATARMVCDFEAGITTSPANWDFFATNFIFFNFLAFKLLVSTRNGQKMKEVFLCF